MRVIKYFIWFCLIFHSIRSIANAPDSLKKLLNDAVSKTKIDLLYQLSNFYIYKNNDSALKYARQGLDEATKQNNIFAKANLHIALGNVYIEKSDFTKGLTNYIEAEKFFRQVNKQADVINAIINIGFAYQKQNFPDKALIQFDNAFAAAEKIDNKQLMGDAIGFIGSIHFDRLENEKALDCFTRARDYYAQVKNESRVLDCVSNMAVVYKEMGRLDEALANFFQLLNYAKKNGISYNQIISYHNIAATYMDKKNNLNALLYLDSSAALARQYKDFTDLETIYATFTELFTKQNNFEKAFEYFKLQVAAKDSLLLQTRDKEFIEMSTKYGTEKKDAENKILKAEGEKQRAISIGISLGLFLVAILSFFIFRSYKQKQRANVLLEAQNTEINEKKTIIEEKQKEILDSISYAKRLQEAILPPIDSLKKYFESIFIYYKPKDIVAGDFYWMERKNDHTFIAAADCTGHGVPGAMVSVVCSNALNRAVLEFNLTDPGDILDKTRDLVLETFSKSDKDVKDGMDISLLVINNKTKQIKWAGANNPLWYTQNEKMLELTANKQSIGKTDAPRPFNSHIVQLEKNSSLFLFTDGYADQFGGVKGKKFKYKELQTILLANAELNADEQRQRLKFAFTQWKGNLEQVDDVCIIGVRI